jgi:hypothetical protein
MDRVPGQLDPCWVHPQSSRAKQMPTTLTGCYFKAKRRTFAVAVDYLVRYYSVDAAIGSHGQQQQAWVDAVSAASHRGHPPRRPYDLPKPQEYVPLRTCQLGVLPPDLLRRDLGARSNRDLPIPPVATGVNAATEELFRLGAEHFAPTRRRAVVSWYDRLPIRLVHAAAMSFANDQRRRAGAGSPPNERFPPK